MGLNGWTWVVSGIILTVMSGYVYLFVPKDGQPNSAMAIFFFIGIIFLVIGIVQIFFRKKDDKSVLDSISSQPQEPKIVTMPIVESKPNKVELAIEQMLQQKMQESQAKPNVQTSTPATREHLSSHANAPVHKTQHTNSFSNIYQYKGPVHTPSSGTHAQHPVSQHAQPTTHATHPVQNSEHSIKCRKCGNANHGRSNYCHQCGNRLK